MKVVKPLLKKLKRCRDPDRSNLVALQKARREQAMSREAKAAAGPAEDGQVFGPSGEARDAKRRKLGAGADSIFGPEL